MVKNSRETISELYNKERDYQESIFGDYSKDKTLNLASLILMIEVYLEKAKKAYVNEEWKHLKPDWLLYTKEQGDDNAAAAPAKAYEELIKVFGLSGAALECFSKIDPNHWRDEGIKNKWIKDLGGNNIG